jgi:hypothetical protein
MTAHLSSKQISRWMAGDCTPDAGRHLRECPQCAAESARLKTLLAEFRSSVIARSALEKGAGVPERWALLEHRRRFAGGVPRWKLAAAALAIVVIVPICKHSSDRRREAEAFKADVQLWEAVNAQVSRSVPTPLEPLMKLVAWEPDAVEK